MTSDRFENYDAAYVLGALTGDDRRAFEEHLQQCDRCATSVRELAGMPGIMARANPIEAEAPVPPLPDTLLPRLLATRDRERRRRHWVVGGLAACAAAVLAVIIGVGAVVLDDEGAGGVGDGGSPAELAFEQLVASPVHANGDLNKVDWGTRIDIDCTYDTGRGYEERSYKMIVESELGAREQVAVWKVRPGQDVALTGSTDLSPTEIASIDIVAADGTSLLRARP